MTPIKIRFARPDDRPQLEALMRRLHAERLPAWRDPAPVARNVAAAEAAFFAEDGEDRVLLVCTDVADRAIGYAQAMMDKDFFSGVPQGHLLFLVTDQAQEGRGIARALMSAVEDWASARGATGLMLYVFATNGRARAVYQRFGFEEDMVQMVKPLRREGHLP